MINCYKIKKSYIIVSVCYKFVENCFLIKYLCVILVIYIYINLFINITGICLNYYYLSLFVL